MPPSQSELIQIIFNMELTHLGSEASKCYIIIIYGNGPFILYWEVSASNAHDNNKHNKTAISWPDFPTSPIITSICRSIDFKT